MRIAVRAMILCLLSCGPLFGQDPQDAVVDSAEKRAVIEALCENLEREYIFPDITEKFVLALKENLQSGKYDGIEKPQDFAREITDDMASVHRDRHLNVRFNPNWVRTKGTERSSTRRPSSSDNGETKPSTSGSRKSRYSLATSAI